MKRLNFNFEKAKSVLLFIVHNLDQPTLFQVFKTLYFADMKHLAKYGSPILKDHYVAMKDGPVPSLIYNLFKSIRGEGFIIPLAETFYNAFEIEGNYRVIAKENPNLKLLSKSDINCISESLAENGHLDFGTLSEKSHDAAWKSAIRNNEIDFKEIARVGGASEEMMKYIGLSMKYDRLQIC